MSNFTQNAQIWNSVCTVDDLVKNSGVCALLNDQQIAIFSVEVNGELNVYAIGNWDPIGKANVLYRGLIGSIGDDVVVASPLYKQHFSLTTGKCYEDDSESVLVYEAKIVDNTVQVAA